ncbi:SH3 domain-containing protein [bacterium]|nr:SH3 domain-containing protein [bacterium]
MKSLVKISVLVLLVFFTNVTMDPVFAETREPQSFLPIACERSKGNYRPMTTLVLVQVTDRLAIKTGATAEEIAKSLFFDFAYVRGNNVSPINAISHNGEIAYLSCDFPDYLTNVVSADDTGNYIMAISGAVPVKEVQEIINKLKLSKLQQAELVTVSDEKNTTIALANVKTCTQLCMGLSASKEAISQRAYEVSVGEPTYSKSVRQKELVSFSVKVKNDGEFPIYSTGKDSLYLAPHGPGLSRLYHSSWLAPSVIVRTPGLLLPGEETALAVTLGAPLLPGKYGESLVLKIGNTQIGKPIDITFTVENDHYKLGRIISRDGADFVNLRQTPSLSGSIINRLDIGIYVIIRGYQDAWVKIETKEGRTGWIYKPFISERL